MNNDLISRNDLWQEVMSHTYPVKILDNEHKVLTEVLRLIGNAPTVERPTGEWIEQDGFDGDVYYDCSACGESWCIIGSTPWQNGMNFCPHCGAYMKGGAE